MPRSRVAAASDVPAGTVMRAVVDGLAICVVHASDDRFYALVDACTHEGQSLSEGELWGMDLECPGHLSRFDVRTGAVSGPPAELPAQTFSVTVENGEIFVDISRGATAHA